MFGFINDVGEIEEAEGVEKSFASWIKQWSESGRRVRASRPLVQVGLMGAVCKAGGRRLGWKDHVGGWIRRR